MLHAGDHVDPADPRASVDDAMEANQARELVMRALQALSVDRRAVLVMHDLDGFGMPEITTALSIPLDTGYSRLRLARKDLKEAAQRLRRQGKGER
jgi:RNA polymerase sigma-70 factor (ECF subfamily)